MRRAWLALTLIVVAAAPSCTCKKKHVAQTPVADATPAESAGGPDEREGESERRRARQIASAAARRRDGGVGSIRPMPRRDGGVALAPDPSRPPPIRTDPPESPADIRSPADPYYDSELTKRSAVSISDTAIMDGSRGVMDVRNAVAKVTKPIEQCHRRAKGPAGALVLDVAIDERGVIGDVNVQKNDVGPDVARCAELRIRSVRFGAGEAARARVSLRFEIE